MNTPSEAYMKQHFPSLLDQVYSLQATSTSSETTKKLQTCLHPYQKEFVLWFILHHKAFDRDAFLFLSFLKKHGMDFQLVSFNALALIRQACENDSVSLLRWLFEEEKLMFDTEDLEHPLIYAFRERKTKILEYLVRITPFISSTGNTPLMVALRSNNLALARWLINEKKQDINGCNTFGVTPLISVLGQGHLPLIDYCLSEGANPWLKTAQGMSAFHFASINHGYALKLMPTDSVIEPDVLYVRTDPEGGLHYAIQGHERIFRDHISCHQLTNLGMKPLNTPLTSHQLEEIIRPKLNDVLTITMERGHAINHLLLEFKWFMNKTRHYYPSLNLNHIIDDDGYTLLHWLIKMQQLDAIRFLCEEHGADPTRPDLNGRNLATFAVEFGDADLRIADYFIQQYGLTLEEDKTLLSRCIMQGKSQRVKQLWSTYHFDFSKQNPQPNAFLCAAQYPDLPFLTWLLTHHQDLKLDPKAPLSHNNAFGHMLARHNHVEMLSYCLKHDFLRIQDQDPDGLTFLDVAVEKDCIETVRFCIQWIREYNQKKTTQHPIYLRTFSCYLKLLALFQTDKELSLSNETIENGQPTIHLVCEHSDKAWIKQFIHTHKLNVNQKNALNETPLGFMIKQRAYDKARWFIETFQPKLTDLDAKKSSLLHLACQQQHLELIEFGLKKQLSALKTNLTKETSLDLILLTQHREGTLLLWDSLSKKERKTTLQHLQQHAPQHMPFLIMRQLPPAPIAPTSTTKKTIVVNTTTIQAAVVSAPIPVSASTMVSVPEEPMTEASWIAAINAGNTTLVQRLKAKTDFKSMPKANVDTILYAACRTKNLSVIQELLHARGLEQHFDHETVLFAIQGQHDELFQFLLTQSTLRDILHAHAILLCMATIEHDSVDNLIALLECPRMHDVLPLNEFELLRAAKAQQRQDIVHVLESMMPAPEQPDLPLEELPSQQHEASMKDTSFMPPQPEETTAQTMNALAPLMPLPHAPAHHFVPFTPDMAFNSYPCPNPMVFAPYASYIPMMPVFHHDIFEHLKAACAQHHLEQRRACIRQIDAFPMLHDDLFQILYDVVGNGNTEIIALLLTSTVIQHHVLTRGDVLCAMASWYGHIDTLRLLLEATPMASTLAFNHGQCLRYAIRNGHEALAMYLLSYPTIAAKAHHAHNYALRMAIKWGYASLACLLLEQPRVMELATLWGNHALRLALCCNITPVITALLRSPAVLYHAVQHQTCPELIQTMLDVTVKKLKAPQHNAREQGHVYFCLSKFCIQHPSPANMKALERLLAQDNLKHIAHLSFSMHVKHNELLNDAECCDNTEAESLLRCIPEVMSMLQRRALKQTTPNPEAGVENLVSNRGTLGLFPPANTVASSATAAADEAHSASFNK